MSADQGWRDPLALVPALAFGVAAGLLTRDRLGWWAVLAGAVTGLLVLLTYALVRSLGGPRARRGPTDVERAGVLLAEARRAGRDVPGSAPVIAALDRHLVLVAVPADEVPVAKVLGEMEATRDLLRRAAAGDEAVDEDLAVMLRVLRATQQAVDGDRAG
ncbi:hypothetical protein [Saccharothrix syringae]|uniref:Uncharacterized protein n=1 Tax=Saccharothrix syringae TaxID=103733 RepID=A0A5Q0H4W0_SACSY|nr:hypothetical protein [Saccharothrix syringae]QFZ21278.1 hypothetical protein EKG83_31295 [Saccharothrix syringae]